jgi:hypothetical protein
MSEAFINHATITAAPTVDPVVAMKAELERIEADADRLEQAGERITAERLRDRAADLWKQIREVVPISCAGMIAQLEILRRLDDDPGNLDVLIARVRNIEGSLRSAVAVPDTTTDSGILSLFREWIAAERAADALGEMVEDDDSEEKAAFDGACDRCVEIERAIADTPVVGPDGIAIKAFLCHRNAHGGHLRNPGALAGFDPELYGEDPQDAWTRLEISIIEECCAFRARAGAALRCRHCPPNRGLEGAAPLETRTGAGAYTSGLSGEPLPCRA